MHFWRVFVRSVAANIGENGGHLGDWPAGLSRRRHFERAAGAGERPRQAAGRWPASSRAGGVVCHRARDFNQACRQEESGRASSRGVTAK